MEWPFVHHAQNSQEAGLEMNDFTKDELDEILTCVCVIPYTPNQTHLVIKLKSMIDNYCDHFECPHCHSLRDKNSPNSFCCGGYEYENK